MCCVLKVCCLEIYLLKVGYGFLKVEFLRVKILVSLWLCVEINSVRMFKFMMEILCVIVW